MGAGLRPFHRLDFASRYSPPESWHKLQQALDVPVEVRFSPDHLPAQAEITLQEVINTWQPAQAAAALQQVALNLAVLRLQITPEFRALLERYLSTVQSYLSETRPGSAVWLAKEVHRNWPSSAMPPARNLTPWISTDRLALPICLPAGPNPTRRPRRPPGLPGANQPKTPQP